MKNLLLIALLATSVTSFASEKIENYEGTASATVESSTQNLSVNIRGDAATAILIALKNAPGTKIVTDSTRTVVKNAGSIVCEAVQVKTGEVDGTPVYTHADTFCAIRIDSETSKLIKVLKK